MICNVDKTWTLEPQDIHGLNATVAKVLADRATSKISTFNTDRFVKYMYDVILDGTSDVQKALAFTRHVPTSILNTVLADPQIRKALTPKGYATAAVETLQDRFANSLQDVVNFINEQGPQTSPTRVAAGIKALTTAEQLQPEPTPEPLDKIDLIENRDAFSNLPYSPLTTTGNEMIEGREWYYDFIKKLNDVFIKTGLSNDGTVGYSGVEDGIRVTMVRGGVPASQAYPDRQGIIDIQQTLDNSIHMVVTDKNGNTLYFDQNYNVTTEDQGRMVYFPIRTIPSFTLVNGQRVFNLSEQEGRTIVPVESRVKAGETKADVETEYQIAYNAMTDAVVYLRDNPEEKILIDITGLSRGTLDYNPQAKTPISSIKNLGEFTIAVKGTKGRQYKYIRATNVSVEIPIVMDAYEGSVASKVADLLLNPVYNSNGVLITGIQKLNVIKPYTTLGKGGITIDDAGVIRLNDNILDVNDLATAKKEIIDFLTREIPTSKKDANGDIVSIKNQFHYNHDAFKKQTEIHDFTLEPRADGGFDYKFVTVSYKDWTKEHSTIPINLDANGEVKEFNGYIKYQINIDSLRKMAKPTSFGGSIKKVTAATTPSVKESTTPVEEDLPESIKNAIKAGVLGVDKLLSVKKGGTVAEAVGKVKAGKKWFEKTELTFKDENGNTVTKKLSEVMPYTALFNVVNSDGKILADWTRNGITLYNGSDYTELYHEAWHGFTQMFLTPAQRQELYNGVKSLDVDIRYYDHTANEWKTMRASQLDFSNADHILYAEEYLADAFKAYALDKKAISTKFKNIFQKIWEALKALFSRTSKESITDPMSVPLIKKAFNNLYTGNLVDYTFNQANIQFARLNSGITAINPKEGQINGLNITDSLAVVDMINSHISDFVDLANSGAFGSKTSAYTANTVLYNPVKRVALDYAKERLQKDLVKIQTEIEELPDGIAANILIKKAATLTTAIENFGDTEDIQNNKTDGVLAFYNKRTSFLNLEAKLLEEPDGEDESIPEVDNQGNIVSEGKGRDGLSAGSGNEFSAYDRLPAVMIYVMGSIHERTVVDSKVSPDGFMRDKYGTKKTILARTMYNLLSSKLEGVTDRKKMYDKLDIESNKKLQDGSPDPKAQMIKQFLNKMGSPQEGTELSQTLWNNFYNSVRYDRVPGVQVTVKQNASTGKTTIAVGNTDGPQKALTRKLNLLFVNKRTNPSSFIKVDQNNVLMLDVEKLRKKYPNVSGLFVGTPDKVSSNIIGYLNDWGFTVTPSSEFINDIIKSGFISTFHNYTVKPLYASLDEGKAVEITSLDSLMKNQAKTFNFLLNAEVKSNPEYTDYMTPNSNGDTVSERFNPSGVGTMIADVNDAKDFNDVINQPHLSQFNPQKNAYVKASQIFKKMFGTGLGARVISPNANTPVTYSFTSHMGTQHLDGEGDLSTLISGMASSASDAETATFRDFWMYNLNGTSEAYRHADKNQTYVGRLEGTDAKEQFYIIPTLFLEKTASTNKGREAGNKIIAEYLAAEIERIRRVQKDNALVTGEKADDVILYGKNGKYTTFKETASKFSIFDQILDTELKEKLLNDTSLQTYEDVIKAMKTNVSLFQDVNNQINSFMSALIEADKQAVGALQFAPADSIFDSLKRTFGTTANSEDRYDAAIENYTYSSFIHRVELEILVYGDLALYNHGKDEHMKRIAAFFATGKVPVMDESYNAHMAKTPGQYAQSEWFKSSNLIAPDPGLAEGVILDTAVLEDPLEDSVYFKTMVDNYMKSKGWPLEDKDKRDIAERKYKNYKDMKVGDAQGWISFDAYRALERRLNNWSPYKDSLYRDILAGKEVDADLIQAFFPVKKMQYAGPLGTENFAVNGFHKYSLMPLIPSMIKDTRLEKLHNKMVSQGIAYTVMHSGSKLASLGKTGKLDLFYKNAKGQNDPAFVDDNYTFTKNPIFLQYLKEQVITQDTLKGKVKMPSQPRKLLTAGMRDAGVPMDFKPEIKDINARRKAWFALKTEAAKTKASKLYEIEKTYIKGIDKIIEISTQKLKMELGYKDPNSKGAGGKPNLNKLVEFIKEQFTTRAELSEYDIDFIKVGSNGELVYPLDLSSNPAQVEKLITALINKRIFDQVLKGEAYIQGSGVGFERFARPSVEDLENYGTGGLRFYTLGPDGRILPMQVKIPLNGDFTKLLDLNDLDGKRIGTLERLNALLKNEEWLNKNDHRKMITMFGARIPTQGMNSLEAMEVAEFLPAAAGNIMILPLEMVAKSGGDFDIDKLVVITPVIKNNQGDIELSRTTKTRKLLKTVIDEKEEIYKQLREVRKKYIKKDLQPEFEVEIAKEQEEQILAKEAFDNNYKNDYYLGGSLDNYINRLDNAQKKIDALYEQLKQEKKEVFAGEFDKYIAAVAPLMEKLRELNRQQDSYSPSAYQNDLLDSMLDIMLRGDNYVNLTIPNDTSIYTGDSVSENPVEVFGAVNRQYRPLKKSPTNVLTNAYNTAKAIAIQAGKVGIGMTATGNTFFSLFKQVGLSLNAVNNVVKKGVEYNIQQKLRLAHNKYIDDNGNVVISMSNTMDADGINDIADTISQLMNGYLDVAKEDWVFDINASKELEPELEFMLMAGVPVNTAVGMLSQPLVREYLRLVKQYSSPYDNVRRNKTEPITFAKYRALKEIMTRVNLIKEDSSPKTEDLIKIASARLDSTEGIDFSYSALKANKNKGTYNNSSVLSFLHFMEISYMSNGLRQLKSSLNVDTARNNTVTKIYHSKNKIQSLSNVFDRSGIDALMEETVLSSFLLHDVFIDSVAALLPLRASSVINNFINDRLKNSNMDMDDREIYQNSFINDLPSYIYANRSGLFSTSEDSYQGIGVNAKVDIKLQPILKFGAFYNQENQTLDADINAIDKDYASGAFSESGYGLGVLATLPKDTFTSYGTKGKTAYRNFVYERELLRSALPYSTISENKEFQLFNMMRNADLRITSTENENLPMRYEEFIRNKALQNLNIDKALFRTAKKEGMYSIADQFLNLVAEEDLIKNYPVLSTLQKKTDRVSTMSFVAPALKEKDGQLVTSYVSQMLELMNPNEMKSADNDMNMVISEFFTKLQTVAFLQAGNNPYSGLYMTNYFDQTAVAEIMREPFGKFLTAINDSGMATALLEDYALKLDQKLGAANKNKFVNYVIKDTSRLKGGKSRYSSGINPYLDLPMKENIEQLNKTVKDIASAKEKSIPFAIGDDVDVYFKNSDNESELEIRDIKKVTNGYKVVLGSGSKDYTYTVDNEGKGQKIEIQSEGVFEVTSKMTEDLEKLQEKSENLWEAYNTKTDRQLFIQGRVPSFVINPIAETITISRAAESSEGPVRLEPEVETAYRVVIPGHDTELYLVESTGKIEDLKSGRGTSLKDFKNGLIKAGTNIEKDSPQEKIISELGFDVTKLYKPDEDLSSEPEFTDYDQPSTSAKREYTPENITSLKPNEVFVFGSNTEGKHGKGAAKTAVDNFGAKYGQAEGPQGQSYAIVTKNLKQGERSNDLDPKGEYNALDYIDKQIGDLIAYATKNPDKKFYVTKLGTMLAGWTTKEIGEIWNNQGIIPNNIILPEEFENFVDSVNRETFTQPQVAAATEVKKGVAELFDSNPELANAVYEALGFEVATENIEIIPDVVGKAIEVQTVENEFYKAKIISIEKRSEDVILLKAKTVKGKEYSYLINLQGEAVGTKQHFEFVDSPDLWKGVYTYNVNSQQKQQALQLYSEYLDTIFPDSQVKDIVYHSSPNKIEKFRESMFGTYFSYSPIQGAYGNVINTVILNIKNPLVTPGAQGSAEAKEAYNKDFRSYNNPISFSPEGIGQFKYDGSIEASTVAKEGVQVKARNPEQIYSLGTKQDIEGFKNFVSQASTGTEVTEVTKFPDLIQPSKISIDVVNYDTGELYPPIMTYNTDKFIKAGTFTLEVADVETIFDENPNSVIVFDNTYPTATGTVDSAPRMNTPYAWRAGLATGKSFGINTRTISGIVPTDDNFDKAKEILDKQLDELIAMRDLGKTILFPSTGVGQNLMGLTMGTDGKYVRGNTVPAPSLFVYLSKRLLQDFGYTNPTFSLIETKSIYDTSILEDRTGMEFIQNFYKEKGMQTTTDSDVLEHIRTCKGK